MGDASMRIGVLHFSHETVTFLKNDTTLEDFIYPGSPAKGEPGSRHGRSSAEIRSQVVHGRLCEDGAGIRMRGVNARPC